MIFWRIDCKQCWRRRRRESFVLWGKGTRNLNCLPGKPHSPARGRVSAYEDLLVKSEQYGIGSILLPPLGSVHGCLRPIDSIRLLCEVVKSKKPTYPNRMYLRVSGTEAANVVEALKNTPDAQ